MICSNCGVPNDDHASHFVQCGQPMPADSTPPLNPHDQPQKYNQQQDHSQQNYNQQPPLSPGPQPYAPAEKVKNYLIESILITICCCLPFGIPAIVYAALSSGKMSSGDIEGAKKMAANARMWCLIGLGAGLLVMVLQAIYMAFMLIANS